MGSWLARLSRSKKNFRILKIDIGDWKSEVAQQHGILRLPTLWLYDGDTLKNENTFEIVNFLKRG